MKTNHPHPIKNILPLLLLICSQIAAQGNYLSPTRMAADKASQTLWVLLETDQSLAKVNLRTQQTEATYPLGYHPGGLTLTTDGKQILITEKTAEGKLHIYTTDGKQKATIPVGSYPTAVCTDKQGKQAWVTNQFSNNLSQIDLKKQKQVSKIPMIREPRALALSPDGNTLAIANYLPDQPALHPHVAAKVTLLNTRTGNTTHIDLPNGSQSLEDVCFSQTGDHLYITHILSRYLFPATQLERGWMNTNAISIIDIKEKKHHNTVLLDNAERGAANPCGMALSEDGQTLYIAISGTHELITINLQSMHTRMKLLEENRLPESVTDFNNLSENLSFLQKDKQRIPLPGKGPRYVTTIDGKVYISEYFSGQLSILNTTSPGNSEHKTISLGKEPPMNEIRKGELYFADAGLCFQNWQSCVSCHPGTRTDGLNWDLINDGVGNPKNTKSMLLAHVTPPCMITGIRPDAETAVRAGIRHIQFSDRPEADAAAIDQYLRSLQPLPSPHLINGKLSPAAQKGEKLYHQAGCHHCHNGSYYTNGQKYDVGTGEAEYKGYPFDTPTLIEVWRTAPYLYNGAAKTIKEVLTTFNREDKHGTTSHLTPEEIEQLEEYVLSL